MSSEIAMGAQYALGDDPDFISDWSSLRKMLQQENEPRKFYLLSSIAPFGNAENLHDFVAARTHMLFADGRVAKNEGEYTKSYAHDVSLYAYSAILGNLQNLGADFVPPPKDLPHEQQALILAKWLKEKWPGCENLEIPRQLAPEEKRPDRKNQGAKISPPPTATTSKLRVPLAAEGEQVAKKSHWPWLIGGGMLLGILFFLIRVFKTR